MSGDGRSPFYISVSGPIKDLIVTRLLPSVKEKMKGPI